MSTKLKNYTLSDIIYKKKLTLMKTYISVNMISGLFFDNLCLYSESHKFSQERQRGKI